MKIIRLTTVGAGISAALTVGCAIPVQQEIELGNQYAAQLAEELPLIDDPEIQRAIDEVMAPILEHTIRPQLDWTVQVVNSSVVNAFAVPGGHLYVNRGLIDAANHYDELAGVMGHEMGHVDLRHSAEQMGTANATQTGLGVAFVLLGREPTDAEGAAVGVVAGAAFAKFSRDDERESDRAAVEYLTKAGINPEGIARMFETLGSLRQSDPGKLEQFFSSHPMPADRGAEVRQTIRTTPGGLEMTETGITDNPVFDRLRTLLGRMPPPPEPQR